MDPPPDARAKDEANAKARETNVEEDVVVVGVVETVVVVRSSSFFPNARPLCDETQKKKERAGLDTKIQFSLDISSETRTHIYIKSANKRRQSSLFRDHRKEKKKRISSRWRTKRARFRRRRRKRRRKVSRDIQIR